MALLDIGDKDPDFALPRDGGGEISLKSLRVQKFVCDYYLRADTPSCTKEAIAFNALLKAFEQADTVILGVSADPVRAQDRFRDKYGLKFALGSDESREMLEAYGVW